MNAQACGINSYQKSGMSYLSWNQQHQLYLLHVVVGFENEDSFIRIVKFSRRKAYAW